MKFSVVLPNCMEIAAVTQPWERDLSGLQIAQVAQLADELGFASALVSEHMFIPRSHVANSGERALHATTALAFIAGATQRIQIGSLVTILPLHNPVVAAKAWATLDWMSGGRAIAGIGVGWLKAEFDVIGVPFERRGRITDEALEAMVELWTRENPEYDGDRIRFRDIAFVPKPVRPGGIPIWVGGDTSAALHRVARFGSGWAPLQSAPERIPERLEIIRSDPAWTDRPLDVFYSYAWMNIGAAHAVRNHPRAAGTFDTEEAIERYSLLSAVGVTETWVPPPPVAGLEGYLDHLRWVAEEVAPNVP